MMRAVDRMTPASRAAGKAVQVLKRVTLAAFRTMRRAARLVGRAFKAMLGPIGLITAALGGLGAVAIFRSFVRLAGQMDEVAKRARAIGISAQDVQELGFAAELTGTSVDLLFKAVQRVTRAAGEAAGIGGAAPLKTYLDVFEALKIEVGEFVKLDATEQFLQFGDALRALEDNTLRLTLAMRIFGARNLAILNLMNESSDAIRAARIEARELGIVLGDEALRVFEDFIDAIARLKGAFRGVRIVIALEFIPLLLDLFESLKNFFVENRGAVREWARDVAAEIRFVVGVLGAFSQMLRQLAVDEEQAAVFGRVLQSVAGVALDVAREVAVAIVKIIKSTIDTLFRPVIEVLGLLGEQAAARFVTRFRNELKTIGLVPFQVGAAIRSALGETLTGALATAQPGLRPFLMFSSEDLAALKITIRNAVDDAAGVAEEKILDAEEILGAAVQSVIRVLGEELDQSGKAIEAAVEGVKQSLRDFAADLEGIDSPAVNEFKLRIADLRIELEKAKLAIEGVASAQAAAAVQTGAQAAAAEITPEEAAKIAELLRDAEILGLVGRRRVTAELLRSFDQEVEAKRRSIQEMQGAEEAFAKWLVARREALNRDLIEINGQFLDGVVAGFDDWREAVTDQFASGMDAFNQVLGTIESGFDQVFDTMVRGLSLAGDFWKEFGRDVLAVISKIIAKQIALGIVKRLFPTFAFASGGIAQGGITPIGRFQKGGIVDRPTLALIGEGRKREAVVPLPDGRRIEAVVTDPDLGSPSEVNVTFEIQALDARGVQQLLTEQSDLLEGLIRRAIASKRDFRETIRAIV
ncbi:MAG: hypothetical protein V3U03_17545 [Myxococcota bacterium]